MKRILTIVLVLAMAGLVFGQSRGRYAGPAGTNAGAGTATKTVAAVDSLAGIKSGANYTCDGVADDVQIQAAMDALPTQGGKVWCAAGAYNLTSPIKVPSNCTLEFEAGNTIKVAASGTHTLDAAGNKYVKATAVTFSALIVNDDPGDGGSGNTNIHIIGANIDFEAPVSSTHFADNISYAGIWLDQCTDSSVERCKVVNVCGDCSSGTTEGFGILFTDCTDCLMIRCEANGNGYEGFGVRSGNIRILVDKCFGDANGVHLMQAAGLPTSVGDMPTYVTFRDCYATDQTDSNNNIIVHAVPGLTHECGHIIIEGCKAHQAHLYGHIDGVSVSNCDLGFIELKTLHTGHILQNVTISNCVLYDSTDAVRVRINPDSTDGASTIQNVLVTNNLVKGGTTASILRITGEDASAQANLVRAVTFANNSIDAAASTQVRPAFYIANNQTVDWTDILITGNNVYDDNVYTGFCGIQLNGGGAGDLERLVIQNNIFGPSCYNFITGYSGSGTGALKDCSIIGNTIRCAPTLYDALSLDNLIVDELLFANNKVPICKYAISQANAAVSNVTVRGNVFDDIRTAFSSGTITNLTVEGNGPTYPIVKTADFTVGIEYNGCTYINTGDAGAQAATLPAAAAGLHYVFVDNVNTAGVDIAVTAAGSDEIYDIDGTTSAGAGDAWWLDSDAYTEIEIACYRAGYWNIIRKIGTIHDND